MEIFYKFFPQYDGFFLCDESGEIIHKQIELVISSKFDGRSTFIATFVSLTEIK